MTEQNDNQPQWQSYIEMVDVKRWLQIPPTDTTRDLDIQDTVDAACYWVQDYLGRPIAPTTFFRRFSGWQGVNGAYVELPYYPVLQIVSAAEWWGSSGKHTLTEQTPSNQGGSDTYQLQPLTGLLIRTFAGLVQKPWFPGSRNIEVEWVAGFNPTPPTARLATRALIRYWWTSEQEGSRSFRQAGEAPPDPSAAHLWPGVPSKVTTWLEPMTQVGMG